MNNLATLPAAFPIIDEAAAEIVVIAIVDNIGCLNASLTSNDSICLLIKILFTRF